MKYLLKYVVLASILVGCNGSSNHVTQIPAPVPGNELPNDLPDESDIDGITYKTLATKEGPSQSWVDIQGEMDLNISFIDSENGTFFISHYNYDEPQFVFNRCSGDFKGKIKYKKGSMTEIMEDDSWPTNDFFFLTQEERANIHEVYLITANSIFSSLEDSCRPPGEVIPFTIFKLKDGSLIVRFEYRNLKMSKVDKTKQPASQVTLINLQSLVDRYDYGVRFYIYLNDKNQAWKFSQKKEAPLENEQHTFLSSFIFDLYSSFPLPEGYSWSAESNGLIIIGPVGVDFVIDLTAARGSVDLCGDPQQDTAYYYACVYSSYVPSPALTIKNLKLSHD